MKYIFEYKANGTGDGCIEGRNAGGSETIVQNLLLFIPSAVAEKVNYSAPSLLHSK